MDAATPPGDPDASGPPRVTDINPPLTPDDPCRQLKMTFEVDVLAADVARLGDLLVVAYQTETGTFVSTYRDEILENTWPLPAGPPRMYYSRDELHIASTEQLRPVEVLPDAAPRLVQEEIVNTFNEGWHIAGTTSSDDDLVLVTASRAGVQYRLNEGQRGAPPPPDIFYTHSAGDVWRHRSGIGVDATLTAGELLVASGQLYSRAVALKIVDDDSISEPGRLGSTPLDATSLRDVAVVMESPNEFVAAMRFSDKVAYYASEFGTDTRTTLGEVDGTVLASFGVGVEVGDPERLRAVFVERLQGDDGLSGSWRLVEPRTERVLAVARQGLAGVSSQPSALIKVAPNRVMWAGPTIQDGNTPNYPQDAIAVCEMEIE